MAVLNGKISGFSEGIYIGRRRIGIPGSVLGNPFKVGRDGTRAEVVEKYRYWLWEQIQGQNQAVISELLRIHETGSHVICWCSPLPCHGDVVLRAAAWLAGQKK